MANFFKDRREALDMSQSDVSFALARLGFEMTVGAVQGWEKGQVPSMDLVDALAKVYKSTRQEVLQGIYESSKGRAKKTPADVSK